MTTTDIIQFALTASSFIGLLYIWRKEMTNEESVVNTITSATAGLQAIAAAANTLTPTVANLQTAAQQLIQEIQNNTGQVPQSIIDAANALAAESQQTQITLDMLKATDEQLIAIGNILFPPAPTP